MIIVPLELAEFRAEINSLYALEADKYARGEDTKDIARALELVENMMADMERIAKDLEDCKQELGF